MIKAVFPSAATAAALLLLSGCATTPRVEPPAEVAVIAEEETGWRKVASDEDETKIEALAEAWEAGLSSVTGRSLQRAVDAEGALLDPAAALAAPQPTPGNYMCRVVRLGSERPRDPSFQAFKPFFCYVGVSPDNQISITKQTGSERPAGYLFEAEQPNRMVFLGSLALGTEDAPLPYGEDPERDVAGVFERIAAFRYRLVIPRPRGLAKLDVIELVPAPVQAE